MPLTFNHTPQPTPDGGPFYAETDFSHAIVEPWNAFSSLTFLIPVIYWAWRLRGQYRHYWFITLAMPLLALGGIGSTVFHAFRSSPLFLQMDVLPILVLTLSVSVWLWAKVFPHWIYVIGLLILYSVINFWLIGLGGFSAHAQINISYFLRGTMIFLPALLLQLRTNFVGLRAIVTATILFIVALIFRRSDMPLAWMPMGTHWLWHVCCAIGAHYLALYLYLLEQEPQHVSSLQAK
ncbi:Ceramidase [Catalinimonas alkaloidigena]|uniref:Ceramidase n=1 Tax=Catalinimonas alkaloidigena TaxID=1075417 RepID=A0A1G9MJF4_9BACT|nr:hypothetical protein [Catalinimonas alkaloidigena]SDL74410.1 Ceramidase [Catalinimonas alkaloidigena]